MRRQLLKYAGQQCYLSRGVYQRDIRTNEPTVVVAMTEDCDVAGYVAIKLKERFYDDMIDVYMIDTNYNTIWCESDAINPMGYGRVFQCGKEVRYVVINCRLRHWWQRFAKYPRSFAVEISDEPIALHGSKNYS